MRKTLKATGVLLLISAVTVLGVAPALAGFPDKEVKLIIPYKPGGATDTIFRVVIDKAQDALGKPIVPINMGGASATKGSRYVKKAKPDGYVILGHHDGISTVYHSGMTDFSFDAFEPICLLTSTPNILTVHYESPYNSLQEIIDFAKANPGKMNFTFSAGSTSYYFFINLFKKAGADPDWFRQVPINGTGRQIKSLLGKHVDLVMTNIPSALQYVKEKKLKFIALAHDERLPQVPDLTTFKETGIDFVQATNRGVFAPKGTSADRVSVLNDAFKKACEDKALQDKIFQMGSLLVYKPPKEFAAYLKKLDDFYGSAIQK